MILLRVRFAESGETGKELVFILRGRRPKSVLTRKLSLVSVENGSKHAREGAGRPAK